MTLTKPQRAALHGKYGGRCAYCGNALSDKWHADHLAPVVREGHWVGRKYVTTGIRHPDRDHLANLMPSCVPCNIDKSDSSLEAWRKRLERSADILQRNYSTFRHALRFQLVTINAPTVLFYFERPRYRVPTSPHSE